MKKVLISLSNDTIFFSYYTKPQKNIDLDLTNTNIIKTDELVFSLEYILTNEKILASFLNDLIKENKIKTINIADYQLTINIMPVINKLIDIDSLIILDDNTMPYSLYELLIENKNIKLLNIASAPPYILEMLDKKGLTIETRHEILFTSNFMALNNLSQYSKIFYKTSIRIEKEFIENDFEDFETFCKINNYLKNIHLFVYNKVMFKKIAEVLRDARMKKVKISLHKNITTKEDANEIKKIKKEFESKYNFELTIVYSDSYLKDNIFSHLVTNILKTVSILLLVIVIAVFGAIMFNNYISLKKVENISKDLNKIIDKAVDEAITNDDEESDYIVRSKYKALLEVNSDTVGWLRVNNTNIDYPIVQTDDNSFYLTNDYYKNNDYSGWVFMDYRNSINDLGRNTIIYGHNRFSSGVMFGTLTNALKKDWYMNEENQLINFETLYEELEWQIFSIYKIQKTSDYIETKFLSDDSYLEFLEMIRQRSINYFDVDLTKDDKILTLSTCMDQNNRLVVHAVLKK